MKVYHVPQPLMEAIAKYLASRPWGEVEQAMAAIRSLTPPKDEEEPKEVQQ